MIDISSIATAASFSQSVERLGWALVHSLWLLTAVAIVAAIVLRLMRNKSASARYRTAVLMLVMMTCGPVTLWFIVSVSDSSADLSTDGSVVSPDTATSRIVADTDHLIENSPIISRTDAELQTTENTPVGPAAQPTLSAQEQLRPGNDPAPNSSRVTASESPAPQVVADSTTFHADAVLAATAAFLRPRLPILVCLWLAGVLFCAIRPGWSIYLQGRLRRIGLSPIPAELQEALGGLIRQMQISRTVQLAQSSVATVPLVVGYLRPLILMPACVIVNLTPAQLQAVLAHELAHIRRHDWLINAWQVVVETILFFHPAVWWLSRRIRHERELCCDDIALSLVGDKAIYARTLLTLEELKQQPNATTLAATGGELTRRIRRLLPASSTSSTSGGGTGLGLALSALVLCATLLATTLWGSQPAPSESLSADQQTQPEAANAEGENGSDNKSPADRAAETPAATLIADAAEKAATTESTPPGPLRRTITVLDSERKPVVGAEVRLQFEAESPDSLHIKAIVTESTDENGRIELDIPPGSQTVHVDVNAVGFGAFSERQQAAGESVVSLKRGRTLRVRAVDEAGHVLNKAVPLMEDLRIWGREFVPQDDGTFLSPALDLERRMMRVVSAQDDGPLLFSDLIDAAETEPGDDGVLQVTLRPGVKLTGRLDDSVPRPISEGYALLSIVEGPGHRLDSPGERTRRNAWLWSDLTAVSPDGTFTFDSLPGGGIAQVHVVVEGHMSINPPLEELARIIVTADRGDEQTLESLQDSARSRPMWPHLAVLDQPVVEMNVACHPTASCDFRILDPAGQPVTNATVSMSPNGGFCNGRLFIPGPQSFVNSS
ncbi:MAG: M48 family metalloprotease, partial [Planctomycetaceae bacterium]|nr:M48 family metalloprotease [Planctomycetaceae bacterium]